MRAGSLRHPAEILVMDADLQVLSLGVAYLSVLAKDSAEPPYPSGLRSPAKVACRGRYTDRIVQGRYLKVGPRLFHIDSARDALGTRADLAITATELIGEPARYLPERGAVRCCRVFMNFSAPFLDQGGQVTDYRTLLEVAVIEAGRPQEGDVFEVGGERWTVSGYAGDTDDGIVRALWVERS
ncbi:hypothetical protein [Pseudomonas sp. RIT-PI-AD]|uniref:head-tail joining protein n=1 Tax=Pseudomonas sp. RIT-PI-AD TaxID=3035294 RepID=UPI0021DAC21F|nr:hypothetical protein [Pseudomonas sp. RIT-PI-AD]